MMVTHDLDPTIEEFTDEELADMAWKSSLRGGPLDTTLAGRLWVAFQCLDMAEEIESWALVDRVSEYLRDTHHGLAEAADADGGGSA